MKDTEECHLPLNKLSRLLPLNTIKTKVDEDRKIFCDFGREFTEQKLNTYIGHRFETICESYLKEEFYNGKMPFFAEEVGRWWGNNPVLKKQEEIDILAIDEESAVICEFSVII